MGSIFGPLDGLFVYLFTFHHQKSIKKILRMAFISAGDLVSILIKYLSYVAIA